MVKNLAVKKLSALFRGITSKHEGEFYCLIFFIHTVQKISFKSIKKYVKIIIIAM